MDKTLIERLAVQAWNVNHVDISPIFPTLSEFAALVAEECARVCLDRHASSGPMTADKREAWLCAAAIRDAFKP